MTELEEATAVMKRIAKDQALNSLRNQPRGIPMGWSRDNYLSMLRKMHANAIKAGATEEEIKSTGFTRDP